MEDKKPRSRWAKRFRHRKASKPFSTYGEICKLCPKLNVIPEAIDQAVGRLLASPVGNALRTASGELVVAQRFSEDAARYAHAAQIRVQSPLRVVESQVNDAMQALRDMQIQLGCARTVARELNGAIDCGVQDVFGDKALNQQFALLGSGSLDRIILLDEHRASLWSGHSKARSSIEGVPVWSAIASRLLGVLGRLHELIGNKDTGIVGWAAILAEVNCDQRALRGFLDTVHSVNHGMVEIQRTLEMMVAGKSADNSESTAAALNETPQQISGELSGGLPLQHHPSRRLHGVQNRHVRAPVEGDGIRGSIFGAPNGFVRNGVAYYSRAYLLHHFQNSVLGSVVWPALCMPGAPIIDNGDTRDFLASLLPPEISEPVVQPLVHGDAEQEFIENLMSDDEVRETEPNPDDDPDSIVVGVLNISRSARGVIARGMRLSPLMSSREVLHLGPDEEVQLWMEFSSSGEPVVRAAHYIDGEAEAEAEYTRSIPGEFADGATLNLGPIMLRQHREERAE